MPTNCMSQLKKKKKKILVSIKFCIDASTVVLKKNPNKIEERLITTASNRISNIRTNRKSRKLENRHGERNNSFYI